MGGARDPMHLAGAAAQPHEQRVSDRLNDGAAHADGVGSGGMTVSPPLFGRIPGPLFGPLAGGHATLYWAMLSTFYHHEFEREPFFLVRAVVVDTTEELVRESSLWSERREELLALGEEAGESSEPGSSGIGFSGSPVLARSGRGSRGGVDRASGTVSAGQQGPV